MRRILMVAPSYYSVVYEINPWMNRAVGASQERAQTQWDALYHILTEGMEAHVLLAAPHPDWPDMVFTANAGLVDGNRVMLSRFRHPERQGETELFRQWFEQQGYQPEELPDEMYFEGEGDALWVGDTLFAGYHWRSEVPSHQALGEWLGRRVLSLQLVDPQFYHLDTCFCPLDTQTVAYYPAAFDEYARRVIQANVPNLIEVSPEEAQRFACNAVVLGRRVALNTGCPKLEAELRARDFDPYATPLDEFLKAGGSAKCLTLHLDRQAGVMPLPVVGETEDPEDEREPVKQDEALEEKQAA